MQKKLIALAVAGLIASPVFAQSSIQIYGRVDASYVHRTNDLKGAMEDEESASRLGFLGEEDLGGGLKAFFQLEERFYIDAGAREAGSGKPDRWADKSWVGLRSNTLGEIMVGRVPTVLDTIYGGDIEVFGGDTIGQMPSRRAAYTSRYNNSARYATPVFGGVKLYAHYALPEGVTGGTGTAATGNAQAKVPFGLAASGTWGNAKVEAGWQKDTTALQGGGVAGTHVKTWIVDGSYNFGFMKLTAAVSRSKGYNDWALNNEPLKDSRYMLGAIVPVGASGSVRANVGRVTRTALDTTSAGCTTASPCGTKLNNLTHFGLGYWYGLSKRTTLMANVSYEKMRDNWNSTVGVKDADNQTGVQFALRHEF